MNPLPKPDRRGASRARRNPEDAENREQRGRTNRVSGMDRKRSFSREGAEGWKSRLKGVASVWRAERKVLWGERVARRAAVELRCRVWMGRVPSIQERELRRPGRHRGARARRTRRQAEKFPSDLGGCDDGQHAPSAPARARKNVFVEGASFTVHLLQSSCPSYRERRVCRRFLSRAVAPRGASTATRPCRCRCGP